MSINFYLILSSLIVRNGLTHTKIFGYTGTDDKYEYVDDDDNSPTSAPFKNANSAETPYPTPFMKNPFYTALQSPPSMSPTPYPSLNPTIKTFPPSLSLTGSQKKKRRKKTGNPSAANNVDTPIPVPTPWQMHPILKETPAPTPWQMHPSRVMYPTPFPTPFLSHPANVKPSQQPRSPYPRYSYFDDFVYFDNNDNGMPLDNDDEFSSRYLDTPVPTPYPDLLSDYPTPSSFNLRAPPFLSSTMTPTPSTATLTPTPSTPTMTPTPSTATLTPTPSTATLTPTPSTATPSPVASTEATPTSSNSASPSLSLSDSTPIPVADTVAYPDDYGESDGDNMQNDTANNEELPAGGGEGAAGNDTANATGQASIPPAHQHQHHVTDAPSPSSLGTQVASDDPMPETAAEAPSATFLDVLAATFVRTMAALLLLAATGVAYWTNRESVARLLRRLANLPGKPANYSEVELEGFEEGPRFTPTLRDHGRDLLDEPAPQK